MEYKRRLNSGAWFQKTLVSLVFGLFTASAEASGGLFPPSVSASPLSTNVPFGDTVSFTASANGLLSVLSSYQWYYNGSPISAANLTVNLGGLLGQSTVSTTLTIKGVSTNNIGSYTCTFWNLLGGNSTAGPMILGVTPTVTAVPNGTGMVTNGFKLQFSAPVGSNLVIQASSDMNHWSPICTNVVPASGSVSYTDAAAKTVTCRFYRARLK